jgi:hypothetical protein
MRIFKIILLLILIGFSEMPVITAAINQPDARSAFIRSMILPGWGHYYADQDNWNRGKIHLGTEAVLIASYFGLLNRASNLEERYFTHASLKAGVQIDHRSRAFQLAIGDYSNLREYNDYQLRSRNWNRLLEETAENNWNWQTENDRARYNRLRSDRDRVKNQLPGILGLMAVNRVISALSAYNHVRNQENLPGITVLPFNGGYGLAGAIIHLDFRF